MPAGVSDRATLRSKSRHLCYLCQPLRRYFQSLASSVTSHGVYGVNLHGITKHAKQRAEQAFGISHLLHLLQAFWDCAVLKSVFQMYRSRARLVPGHCCISTLEHCPSSCAVNDFAWREVRNLQKCLLQIFAAEMSPSVLQDGEMLTLP